MKQDICMETVHGRKSKSQTSFKAVLNKVLVSALILGTVAGMGTPAFAAESLKDMANGATVNQEYGVSVTSAISSLRNTIATINQMKANGSVSANQIKTLASQLYTLESVAKGNVTSDVVSVINDAESAIKGVTGVTEAEVAIAVVRDSLGIDTVTATNKSEANEIPTSFSDVKSDHWAYSAITNMTEKGLFSGKGQIVNGVGTFAPNDTMSRAEFITVVVRALYKDELTAMPAVSKDTPWYSNAYSLAIDKGLLNKSELNGGDLAQPMTRQEMAMVLVRAAEKKGETPSQLIDTSRIADYDSIGRAYRNYVVQCYSMGMLCGTDNKGTYAPLNSLNRAAASVVLYRLVEPSSRQKVDFTAPTTPETPQGQSQKWVEGQAHSEDPKVGDIVVKNGKEITLKIGFGGVLAAGQGVDIYSGQVFPNGRVVGDGTSWLDGSTLRKDPISGEMHTGSMWADIYNAQYPHDLQGDYDGEVYGTWFKWDANLGLWDWMGPSFA